MELKTNKSEKNEKVYSDIPADAIVCRNKNEVADPLSLIHLVIPEGTTEIEDRAFESCSHLRSVYIPESVLTIGDYAFMGCSKLKKNYGL